MYIKHAAIMYPNGEVVSGFDKHHKIIALQAKLGISTPPEAIHGFVDGQDNFLTRADALVIAKAAGQVPEDFEGELYDEDLWKTPTFLD